MYATIEARVHSAPHNQPTVPLMVCGRTNFQNAWTKALTLSPSGCCSVLDDELLPPSLLASPPPLALAAEAEARTSGLLLLVCAHDDARLFNLWVLDAPLVDGCVSESRGEACTPCCTALLPP